MDLVSQVTKLEHSNYMIWSTVVKALLKVNHVWDHIEDGKPKEQESRDGEDEIPPLPANARNDEEWESKDALAQLIICTTISDPQIGLILNCKSAAEMWETLRKHHVGTRVLSLRIKYLQELRDIKIEKDETIDDYVLRCINLREKIKWLSESTYIQDEITFCVYVVNGLDKVISGIFDEYEDLMTSWEQVKNLLLVDQRLKKIGQSKFQNAPIANKKRNKKKVSIVSPF